MLEVFLLDNYRIKGGNVLSGTIKVSGAKNAALPIIAASVMTRGESVLSSCPEISDVDSMLKILKALGCRIDKTGETISILPDEMDRCMIPDELMKEMRSSVFLAGALLTRCGEAVISSPGGCDIGKRPIDIHIDGLEKLGASVMHTNDRLILRAGDMKGTDIHLPYPSVGATENIMMAALGAAGVTRIFNCAREPEIVDLQKYLNLCGAMIDGAGTGIITIEGKTPLKGSCHDILPDRIEAGTYLLMALGTGGKIRLSNINGMLLGPLIDVLGSAGYIIERGDSFIYAVSAGNEKVKCSIVTEPYPGFPTDLQPQLTAFLTRNGAGSVIKENIFENRLDYAHQLKKMGADIEISQKEVIIKNNNILCGTYVEAKDLRGGAALMIAGLMAEGETIVGNTKYIKRGYSRIGEKIRGLGGEITENEG